MWKPAGFHILVYAYWNVTTGSGESVTVTKCPDPSVTFKNTK